MPAHDNLRIRSNEIRPLRRNRANGYIIDTEQQTLPIAVVPLTYARELLATERMKRMRYPHKTRGCVRITCISNGATSGWRKARMRCRFPKRAKCGGRSRRKSWERC
jgi:hypothetical protein